MGIDVTIYTKHDKKELEKFLDYIKNENAKNIAILIRHSIRYPSKNCDTAQSHLTSEGKKLAFWFGTKLPKDRNIRIFHSCIKRCEQTAKYIKNGSESNKIKINKIEKKDFISPFEISYEKFLDKMRSCGSEKFMRLWLEDKLEEGIFRDAKECLSWTLNGILSGMKNDDEKKYLDIYVTHDANIFPIKEFILNAKHEEVGWPECLDGIIIVPQKNNKVKIKWREYEKIIDRDF